jgi:FkbM family methyltransferase
MTASPPAASPPAPPSKRTSGLAAFVARHRRGLVVRKVAGLCRRYLGWFDNVDYELETNGEAFVLETLARFGPCMILDAGANVGDWTRAARARCPDAAIHALEIAPPTYERLVDAIGGLRDVHCVNVGLSDEPGSITIRHYDELPALTTASAYPHPFDYTELAAEVVTGDAFAAERSIDHVDLLKIDVEGMEDKVLRGFDGMLARRAIDLVQFEYGQVNILSGFLLRDFHELFRARGYAVGKIYPTYVDFRPYELSDEDFKGPNYLACSETRADLLAALSGARRR